MVATAANSIAREYLRKFTKAGSLTVARMLWRDHPAHWTTEKACYSMVRRLRGTHGKRNRKTTVIEKDERQYEPRNQFKLPEGMKEVGDFEPVHFDKAGWWLVMSDLHIPWHDMTAISACLAEARKRKVVGILLNGDVADCFAISRWEKNPEKRDFRGEIDKLREFFAALRKSFKHADIVWKHGNHEERYTAYMEVKCPELLGFPEFDFSELSHANKHGIVTVKDCLPIMLGKLLWFHGHEFSRTTFPAVNPARGLFLKTGLSSGCGHHHKTSHHSDPDALDDLKACWSTGCLCDLHPRYARMPKWNHGAAMQRVGPQGEYEVDNFRIRKGKVWR